MQPSLQPQRYVPTAVANMPEEKFMGHLTNSPVENPSDKAATHTHSLKQPEITEILKLGRRPSVHTVFIERRTD